MITVEWYGALLCFFFFQAEDGIRDSSVTGVQTCALPIFEDMEITADALVLPPRGLRKGFADLMNAYNGQRIGAATVALGLAEGAYELGLAYSQERHQFGRPICEFQGVQWMLAYMATQIAAARLLVYKAAVGGGDGFPEPTEAAQAKIFTSEMAIKVTNDALQLFGAAGYSRNRPLER